MARRARSSIIRRFERLEANARTQRVRRKGHTESKTFIVHGPLSTGPLPALFVGLDHDGETPEWKRLTGYAVTLQQGTAVVRWYVNGVDSGFAMSADASAPPEVYDYPEPGIDLAHADRIYPYVMAASGDAAGLSAAAFIVSAAR